MYIIDHHDQIKWLQDKISQHLWATRHIILPSMIKSNHMNVCRNIFHKMAIIKVKFESKGDQLKSSFLNNQTSQKQLKHIQTQSLWCKKGFCAITGSQPILPVHTYINEVNEDQYRNLNHADLYCCVGPNLDSKNTERAINSKCVINPL